MIARGRAQLCHHRLLQQQLVEAKQELIEEEELQDIKEQPKPVPVLVSQTSLAEASALALVDMREAVKLVKDKTLPTKQETIEATQKLITDVVDNLEDMKGKTEVKEQIDEIDALRKEFDAWLKHYDNAEKSDQAFKRIIPILEEEKDGVPILESIYTTRDMFTKNSQWIVGGDEEWDKKRC